jgi:ADP-heptose:LPS heptosyltransferase
MSANNTASNIVYTFFKIFFSVSENASRYITPPQKIIIIRQHNQLGDMLASVSLLRALRETYPDSHLSLVVSPDNYPAVSKNKLIDRTFIFDKRKFINPIYVLRLINSLREKYDLVIVPATVSISFTSDLLARLTNSEIRIGVKSLDGKFNRSSFFFDRRIDLDWRKHPDSNVSERILDIARPFGIDTQNFKSVISFDDDDLAEANKFIDEFSDKKKKFLIGLHVGAGKPNNRWSLDNYAALVARIDRNYSADFYLTGGWAEKEELDYLSNHCEIKFGKFINKTIPQIAALISLSDLFISNDTGIMHVAGTTDTPQISIFGPTNPFNWAPIGVNKYFVRKSELIDDVSINDVYHLCELILKDKGQTK